MVAFGATRLIAVSSTASEIIEKRELASVKISRAGTFVAKIPYSVYGAILSDEAVSLRSGGEEKLRIQRPRLPKRCCEDAATLLPERATALNGFADRVKSLVEIAKPPFDLSAKSPGLEHAETLNPAQITALAQATKLAEDVDDDARALISEMMAYNDRSVGH